MSRILAVADVYDAITNERPYRSAYSIRESLIMMYKGEGMQFDPDVLGAFFRALHSSDPEVQAVFEEAREKYIA